MSTFDFDTVAGTTIAFDPTVDVLNFADIWDMAAQLRFEVLGADLKIWMGNAFVILADTTYGELGTGDLTFARGTVFAAGSNGVDTLRGTTGADFLDGRGGDDLLIGRGGDDVYIVDSAGDVAYEVAGEGVDTVRTIVSYTLGANIENLWLRGTGNINGTGSGTDNRIQAGAGDNIINGGGGIDTASYQDAAAGVSLWLGLTTAQATGGSGSDTLLNIENLYGSLYNDLLKGNGLDNILEGYDGDDTLVGGGGNDRLYSDIAYFSGKTEDAADRNLLNGNDGNDSLWGSLGQDTLTGDAGNDILRGDFGNDSLLGGDGVDNLDGNYGNDYLNGGAGVDTLTGGGGDDTMLGGSGGGLLDGSDGNDWIRETGVNAAVLFGGSGNDTMYGGDGADTLYAVGYYLGGYEYGAAGGSQESAFGGLGNDMIYAGLGNDRLDGGDGIDTVSYQYINNYQVGVRVNLALATVQDTLAGQDTLTGFENAIGSNYADVLRGSAGANRLDGGASADWLIGGSGADVLIGGTGADLFVFAALTDSAVGAMDVVSDFAHAQADRLDLSRLDADAVTAGDQAFAFIGSAAFGADATAQLRYEGGILYASTDADADAEFALQLTGAPALVAGDFIL